MAGEDGVYEEDLPKHPTEMDVDVALLKVAEFKGYYSKKQAIKTMLVNYEHHEIVPGICTFCGDITQNVYAKTTDEFCTTCGQYGVTSINILAESW